MGARYTAITAMGNNYKEGGGAIKFQAICRGGEQNVAGYLR